MPKKIKRVKRGFKSIKSPAKITDTVSLSKTRIVKARHKGAFLKKCPGTMPGYLCCNYYTLNIQTNCNYDCRYCILQSYINNDRITVYSNITSALHEIKALLEKHPSNFYRIGTGELTDSLSLDYKTRSSLKLVRFFNKHKNAVLELKTKSNNINNLLSLKPKKNIIVSWSLNPPDIQYVYEKNTPSVKKRLIAAGKCFLKGYSIGFHLDPLILYPSWEKDYKNLVEEIFKHIPPGNIIWISIAAVRFPQSLKKIIQERFPGIKLFTEEMVLCKDGKFRYLRPLRVSMYKKIIGWIKSLDAGVPIYLCMESPSVWQDVFGKLPYEIDNLKGIFGPLVTPVRL